jgi:hypothetical protein
LALGSQTLAPHGARQLDRLLETSQLLTQQTNSDPSAILQ